MTIKTETIGDYVTLVITVNSTVEGLITLSSNWTYTEIQETLIFHSWGL